MKLHDFFPYFYYLLFFIVETSLLIKSNQICSIVLGYLEDAANK